MTSNSHSRSSSPGGSYPEFQSMPVTRPMDRFNQSVNLLMIDDDETEHFLVEDLLSEMSDLTVCMTGCVRPEEGLHMIRSSMYDLVLLDQRMNTMTGVDLLRKLELNEEDAPIIMLTGYRDEETSCEALLAGASHFLYKAELTANKLEHLIHYTLTNKRYGLNEAERRVIYGIQMDRAGMVLKLDEELVVRYVSLNSTELLGLDHTIMLGQSFKSYLTFKGLKQMDELIEQCKVEPNAHHPIEIKRVDGRPLSVVFRHCPAAGNMNTGSVFVCSRDFY